MVRILKFYLSIILLLGTVLFAISFLVWGRSPGENLLSAWGEVLSVTGLLLVIIFTPIQWIAAAFKRPWLAYVLSILAGPLLFLFQYIDRQEGFVFDTARLSMHARDQWGPQLISFLFGLIFTYTYQRWFHKKA